MKEIGSVGPMVTKLFVDFAWLKWPTAVFLGVWEYIFPTFDLQRAAIAGAVLITLDTITGLVAAMSSGKPVTSARFGRIAVKFLGYGSTIIVSALTTDNVPGMSATKPAAVLGILIIVILTEAISILENVRTMGVKLPFGLEEALKGRIDAMAHPQEKQSAP